jgi:hypothetical protein
MPWKLWNDPELVEGQAAVIVDVAALGGVWYNILTNRPG